MVWISSSPSDKLDPKVYQACMRNKQPSFRIPDEEAHTLNKEQRLVVESVLSGYNTFFTGPAGSGKSHVLEHIRRLNNLEIAGPKKNIVVTATTGLAACNVGGVTIHSFAGVGTGKDPIKDIIARLMRNEQVTQRWRECDILVIDEISMMSAKFLDKLSTVASRARDNYTQPFGGIQLVVCGDFFQLPPVHLNWEKFAFQSQVWPQVITTSVCLTSVFRQNQDMTLVKILNEARVGELSQESIDILRCHSQLSVLPKVATAKQDGNPKETKPTLIECKNAVVDRLNKSVLDKLPGEALAFLARDTHMHSTYRSLLNDIPAPAMLELKVGVTVLLLRNLDLTAGLVNGTRGVVEDFEEVCIPQFNEISMKYRKIKFPRVRFASIPDPISMRPIEWKIFIGDVMVACREQIPLKLGSALTVHKCQGMTIDNVCINLSDTFEFGQAYVALSRATSLDSLSLKGFDPCHFKAHPLVKQFYCLLAMNHIQESNDATLSIRNSNNTLTKEQLDRIEKNRKEAIIRRTISFGLCPSLAKLYIGSAKHDDKQLTCDASHSNVADKLKSPSKRKADDVSSDEDLNNCLDQNKKKVYYHDVRTLDQEMDRLSLNTVIGSSTL